MKELLFAFVVITILMLAVWITVKNINQATIIYKEADELEEEIKKGQPLDVIYPKFLTIHKKGFDINTNGRIRELAKMIEIKYGVDVIKKNI
jgi:hypothetical protein